MSLKGTIEALNLHAAIFDQIFENYWLYSNDIKMELYFDI